MQVQSILGVRGWLHARMQPECSKSILGRYPTYLPGQGDVPDAPTLPCIPPRTRYLPLIRELNRPAKGGPPLIPKPRARRTDSVPTHE